MAVSGNLNVFNLTKNMNMNVYSCIFLKFFIFDAYITEFFKKLIDRYLEKIIILIFVRVQLESVGKR